MSNPLEVTTVDISHLRTPSGDVRPYVRVDITIAVGEATIAGGKATATIRERDLRYLFHQIVTCDGVVPLWRLVHQALIRHFGTAPKKHLHLVVPNWEGGAE